MQRDIDTDAPYITLRLAGPDDDAALARLAALDSAELPSGPTLLALSGGVPAAAMPLNGGRSIADPFQHTSALVAMLELRAAQMRSSHDRHPTPGLASRMRAAARAFSPRPD